MTKRELAEVFLKGELDIYKQDVKKITRDTLADTTEVEYYTHHPDKELNVYDYCRLTLFELNPEPQPLSGTIRYEVSYEIIPRDQGEDERYLMALDRNIAAAQRELDRAISNKEHFIKGWIV